MQSCTKIVIIQSGDVIATASRNQVDEKEFIGEISPPIFIVASKYPGLLKSEIVRIFANKFWLKNLYKLQYLKKREDKDRDKNITIENGFTKLKQVTETL